MLQLSNGKQPPHFCSANGLVPLKIMFLNSTNIYICTFVQHLTIAICMHAVSWVSVCFQEH